MSMDSQIGALKVSLEGDASKLEAACDRANAKINAVMDSATKGGQAMVASNQKTVDSTLGVAAALQDHAKAIDGVGSRLDALTGKSHTAWRAIGDVTGNTVGGMITKVLGFIDTVNKIPDAIDSASLASSQKSWLNLDQQQKSNDLLEQQIAILEKKPVNNAALAMDELRIQTDRVAASMGDVDTRMSGVLSKNHIAAWHALLGTRGTAEAEGTVNSFNQQILDLANQATVERNGGNSAEANRLEQQRRQKIDAGIGAMDKDVRANPDGKYADRGARRSMYLSEEAELVNEKRGYQQDDQALKDGDRLRKDQESERQKAAAKAAAEAAEAARQKQFRDIMARAEQRLADRQQDGNLMTPADKLAFWAGERDAQPKGSLAYGQMNRNVGSASQDELKRQIEDAQKAVVVTERWIKLRDQLLKSNREGRNSDRDDTLENQRRDIALEELGIRERIGRTVTELDGARAMALAHEKEYAATLLNLETKLADVRAATDLKPAEQEAEIAALKKQIAQLDRDHALQQMQDDAAATRQPTSFRVGVRGALNDTSDRYSDAAEQGRDFMQGTLQNFNASLLTVFERLGEKHQHHIGRDFVKGEAKNLSGSLEKMGLEKMEGSILRAFGFGKPDGSRGNPMWVRIDALGGFGGGGALDSIINKSQAGNSGWAGAAGTGATLLSGFLADGGPVAAGDTYLVGERGPELFTSNASGSITPNHKLSVGGYSAGDTHVHVDARGSTNPAEVEMAAHRAVMRAAPHIVAASVQAGRDQRARTPNSRG